MKEFEAPKMEIVTFELSDAIASSGVTCEGDCPNKCDFVCSECACREVAS